MYTAKIQNAGGEVLTLTGAESKWQVFDITGLDPPKAQINLTDLAGLDGARLNSAKLETRNIVIYLKINGDAEANRLELYQFFRTKEECIFFFKNRRRDVQIAGVVESVECPQFTNAEIMQVSIVCPFPYFRSIAEVITDISNEIAGFYFPFAINYNDPIPFSLYIDHREAVIANDAEAETGAVIEIDVMDTIGKIVILDATTGESFGIVNSFVANDRIFINTNKGQKSVYLVRGVNVINLFLKVISGSSFFQLLPGDNRFSYSVDDGSNDNKVFIMFTFANLYRGV